MLAQRTRYEQRLELTVSVQCWQDRSPREAWQWELSVQPSHSTQ
jgi:hypothetical protein